MSRTNLSCRVYKINPEVLREIKSFLKQSHEKILYDTYKKDTKDAVKLYFNVKELKENQHGSMVEFYLDKIIFIPTRNGESAILQTPTYFIQLLENNDKFNDHLIIYGSKLIDTGIKKAFIKYLNNILDGDFVDPLILLKVDFDRSSQLVKEFQNIQYFCTKDVNDDRLQDIIIKGDMLEKTPQYKEFVEEPDTKGDLNFLGITIDGKLLYIGRDGSIYSRNNFSRLNITSIVYTLLNRISSIHAFHKTLDDSY